MSEIMSERLKKSVGKHIKIFLKNGFKFEGKITNCDKKYLEILEPRGFKIIQIEDIADAELSLEKEEENENK